MDKKNGFTFIELLGVILLIGIVALIAVPAVNDIIQNSKQKAYIEGIKFTSIYIIISIIFSFIIKNPFTIKLIISYLSLLLSGIIGSMIGINLKNK